MSAAEQLDDGRGKAPQPRDALMEAEAVIEAQLETPAASRARLRPLLALAPYVARYRGRAFLAFISLTIAAITTLVVPVAVRRVVDFGLSPEGIAMINSYFGVMVALVAVLAGASAARFYLVMTIGERIVADIRRDVLAHLVSLSPSFFDSARSGELVSRLTADTVQIKSAVGASISVVLRNFMLFAGATTMMVITSPRLSGFVLLAIPIIVIPLVAFGRWVRRLTRSAQDRMGAAAAYVAELLGAVRTVQAFTGEAMANARYGGEVEEAYEAARRSHQARGILTAIIIFIIFTSVVIILWVGSRDVLEGTITPGRLGQFVLYAVFAAAGLGQLSEVWGELSAASGAAERLFEILRVSPEIAAPAAPRALPQPARGDVGFDKISFAYPTRPDVLAVDGVSLSVAAGEKVAIVGPSGAGKSTLFHLLLRFYDPKSGTISLDGVPITSVDPHALRARIALVPQDSVVFAASALENIRFGRPDASDAEVERAAGLAHATEFIRRLPDGFEAQLGERGVKLSGGQRQRIALVPQDSVVFAASAMENIRFGRPDASDAEVERAAGLAHATEFIRRLPDGFEAQLGERGVKLSGGQRQRIAIARAILRDAPLLLLDEATSALDAESETLVQTALEELMRHRTTLVIAHRLATVLSCDRILVMDQGRIVEQGTHASLVAANGLYARLARLQFEGV